jgi:site-specific DNA-methyltransferase (adenine-specific)
MHYYETDAFRLVHGDCLRYLETLPDDSVDMIFADPPYNLSNGGVTCHAGRMVSVDKDDWDRSRGAAQDFQFHKAWIAACRRVLKPAGTLWISGTYHSIYACGYALQELDFRLLNDICWFKPNASPNLSCRFFTASHETLLWARKDRKARHTFHYEAMKNGDFAGDTLKKPGAQMRSVWCIPTPKPSEKRFGKHPTQKPEALLERVVLASTNPGDAVLDVFNGSGTTGVVCARLGRSYTGIDADARYLDLTIKRYEALPSARIAAQQTSPAASRPPKQLSLL